MENQWVVLSSKIFSLVAICFLMTSCMPADEAPKSQERVSDRTFDFDSSNLIYLSQEIESCTHITGWVFVRDISIIEDLSFLSRVERVDSGVEITRNTNLKNVDGLKSLKHIGIGLNISINPNLEQINLGELEVLSGVYFEDNRSLDAISFKSLRADYLQITSSPSLQSISLISSIYANGINLAGLPNLTHLRNLSGDSAWRSGLYIRDNTALREISFDKPAKSIYGSVVLQNNPALGTFTKFESLEFIGEDFKVVDTGIEDFSVFESLLTVGGNFQIESNAKLAFLGGLSGLAKVGGELRISDHQALKHVEDFSGLHSVDSLSLINNTVLESAFSVPVLEEIGRNLAISGNLTLDHIPSFDSLERIKNRMYIYGNPQLTDLKGLDQLSEVNGLVVIKNQLKTLNNLRGLKVIQGNAFFEERNLEEPIDFDKLVRYEMLNVGTPASILNEHQLNGSNLHSSPMTSIYATDTNDFRTRICTEEIYESIDTLSFCGYIAGSILLDNIEELESVDSLNSVSHIEGNVEISNNPNLRYFDIGDNLEFIGGALLIKENPVLERVSGFESLRWIGRNFYVSQNASLGLVEGFNQLRSIGAGYYRYERLSYNGSLSSGRVAFEKNAANLEVIGFEKWISDESIFLNGAQMILNPELSGKSNQEM